MQRRITEHVSIVCRSPVLAFALFDCRFVHVVVSGRIIGTLATIIAACREDGG